MTVSIIDASGNITEFYNVPLEVGKAIITLLHECENDDSDIVSSESEGDDDKPCAMCPAQATERFKEKVENGYFRDRKYI